MIRLTRRLRRDEGPDTPIQGVLQLCYDDRKRGRLQAMSTDGQTVGLFLERGRVLIEGDRLASEDGAIFRVEAAPEPVIQAWTEDWLAFSRICYHLGNRHLPLQIGERWLRFQPDHVLEDLVRQYGLQTAHGERPFQPESGAYGAHGHGAHGHGAHGHGPGLGHPGPGHAPQGPLGPDEAPRFHVARPGNDHPNVFAPGDLS